MIITNNSRKQALAVFNRITSNFSGFIYRGNDIADNGQVSVYVRENNDVIYTSNYYQDSTLLEAITKGMRDRVLPSGQEDQRNFDFANTIQNDPYAYSNI
jgi:hypothetical protein